MTDVIDSFPLAPEYPESIRARLLASANAGVDPSDPLYADTVPGSVVDDAFGAFTIELDRLYDRMLNEVPAAALPSTAQGRWLDAWAQALKLLRKDAVAATGVVRFTGPNGTIVPTSTEVSTEAPTADAEPVTFQTTAGGTIAGGHVDLPVVAEDAGSQGNVPANSITLLDSDLGAAVTVSNPAAITSGDDVESDERLRVRVLKKLAGGSGAGNVDYYENLVLNIPGVGFVTVRPNTPGTGDVEVVISDVNNDPVSDALIDLVQQIVDPATAPTQGAGAATIGAEVTVTTPDPHDVTIDVAITPDPGFTVDGSSGTQELGPDIIAAAHRYVDVLGDGDDVVRAKAIAAVVDVEGVANITSLAINSSTSGDHAIPPGEVAVLVAVNPS